MIKKLIPFWMWPGYWGLSGKTRQRAEAEYNLTGYDLDKRMIEINFEQGPEQDLELLKLERKYVNITKKDYDYKYAELVHGEDQEYPLMVLELDKKYGQISDLDYQKKSAEIKKEPWVGVLNSEYNSGLDSDGFSFELDWNQEFVHMLQKEGYRGSTEEEIVEQWFEDKATEEYIKILNEQAEEITETDEYSVPSTHITKTKTQDGKTHHS